MNDYFRRAGHFGPLSPLPLADRDRGSPKILSLVYAAIPTRPPRMNFRLAQHAAPKFKFVNPLKRYKYPSAEFRTTGTLVQEQGGIAVPTLVIAALPLVALTIHPLMAAAILVKVRVPVENRREEPNRRPLRSLPTYTGRHQHCCQTNLLATLFGQHKTTIHPKECCA